MVIGVPSNDWHPDLRSNYHTAAALSKARGRGEERSAGRKGSKFPLSSPRNRVARGGRRLRSRRLVPRGHGLVAQRQPAVLIFGTSFDDGEEFFLKSPGDGPGLAAADHDSVNGADGSYFGGGPGKENFVGDIEHFAGNHLLDQRVAELPRQRDDGVARDARQNRGPERRRKDLAVPDHEDIFPAAFADVPRSVERDPFDVAVDLGLHLDELGVHVI